MGVVGHGQLSDQTSPMRENIRNRRSIRAQQNSPQRRCGFFGQTQYATLPAQVNLFALDGVVRLGSSMGNRLEPCVNTLVPAVCKNLASSNQQVSAPSK